MTKRKKRFTAIDFFSGAGGLTLGLKKAGFDVLAGVESDANAADTYELNHADVRLWRQDIRRITAIELMTKLGLRAGELDMVAGCPPCQGFSAMRTKNGGRRIVDQQNDLLFELLRFVRVLQPKTVMMENVPGLASNRRIREVTDALTRLGYEAEVRVVDAADFNVPQRRRRMILLAVKGGTPRFPRPASRRRSVADAIRGLPPAGRSGDALHDHPESRSDHIKAMIALVPKDGGSRTQVPKRFQLACHRRTEGFFDVYGRMAWDEVSPTITGGCHNPSKGRFLHPDENRAITLREAALLQTFPKNYKFDIGAGKERVALMIGNALPPELISRVAKPMRSVLRRLKESARVGRRL